MAVVALNLFPKFVKNQINPDVLSSGLIGQNIYKNNLNNTQIDTQPVITFTGGNSWTGNNFHTSQFEYLWLILDNSELRKLHEKQIQYGVFDSISIQFKCRVTQNNPESCGFESPLALIDPSVYLGMCSSYSSVGYTQNTAIYDNLLLSAYNPIKQIQNETFDPTKLKLNNYGIQTSANANSLNKIATNLGLTLSQLTSQWSTISYVSYQSTNETENKPYKPFFSTNSLDIVSSYIQSSSTDGTAFKLQTPYYTAIGSSGSSGQISNITQRNIGGVNYKFFDSTINIALLKSDHVTLTTFGRLVKRWIDGVNADLNFQMSEGVIFTYEQKFQFLDIQFATTLSYENNPTYLPISIPNTSKTIEVYNDHNFSLSPQNGILQGVVDPESNTSVISIQHLTGTIPSGMTINSDGSVVYVPSLQPSGTYVNTFKVWSTFDGINGVRTPPTSVMTITINVVDGKPIVTDKTYSTGMNNELTITQPNGLLIGATDAGNDGWTQPNVDTYNLRLIDENGFGTSTLIISGKGVISSEVNGAFVFTPVNNFVGIVQCEFIAVEVNTEVLSRPLPESNRGLLTINVTNSSPIGSNKYFTTQRNQTLTRISSNGLMVGVTDFENNTIYCYKNTDPAHGSVVVNLDGSFTYIPTTDFIGSDSFQFYVTDIPNQSQTSVNFYTAYVDVTKVYIPIDPDGFIPDNPDGTTTIPDPTYPPSSGGSNTLLPDTLNCDYNNRWGRKQVIYELMNNISFNAFEDKSRVVPFEQYCPEYLTDFAFFELYKFFENYFNSMYKTEMDRPVLKEGSVDEWFQYCSYSLFDKINEIKKFDHPFDLEWSMMKYFAEDRGVTNAFGVSSEMNGNDFDSVTADFKKLIRGFMEFLPDIISKKGTALGVKSSAGYAGNDIEMYQHYYKTKNIEGELNQIQQIITPTTGATNCDTDIYRDKTYSDVFEQSKTRRNVFQEKDEIEFIVNNEIMSTETLKYCASQVYDIEVTTKLASPDLDLQVRQIANSVEDARPINAVFNFDKVSFDFGLEVNVDHSPNMTIQLDDLSKSGILIDASEVGVTWDTLYNIEQQQLRTL